MDAYFTLHGTGRVADFERQRSQSVVMLLNWRHRQLLKTAAMVNKKQRFITDKSRSNMALVYKGSYSLTCHPYVYPRMEWAILSLLPAAEHHRTLAGTHFHAAEGRRLSGNLHHHLPSLPTAESIDKRLQHNTVIIQWPEFSQHRKTSRFVAWTRTTFGSMKRLSTPEDFVATGGRTLGSRRTDRSTTVSRDDKTVGDDSSWTLSTISSHEPWSATLFTYNHSKSKVKYTSICIAHRRNYLKCAQTWITQFYLQITPCLPLLPSRRASRPFGWYSFTVPRRVEGWVDLGGWLHTEIVPPPRVDERDTVTHPSTNRARRRVTSLIRPTPLLLRHAATQVIEQVSTLKYDTIRYGRLTCAQKLTGWPA